MYTSLGEARSRPACYGDIGAMISCDSAYPDRNSWRTKDFKHCIRDEDMRCSIVEVGGIFAGYMITETYISTIEIWRLVVDKPLLRCQIGSCLVRGLCGQLMVPRKGPFHKLRNISCSLSRWAFALGCQLSTTMMATRIFIVLFTSSLEGACVST